MIEFLKQFPMAIMASCVTGGAMWATYKLTTKSNTAGVLKNDAEIKKIKAQFYDKDSGELRFMTVDRCRADKKEILDAINELKVDSKRYNAKLFELITKLIT